MRGKNAAIDRTLRIWQYQSSKKTEAGGIEWWSINEEHPKTRWVVGGMRPEERAEFEIFNLIELYICEGVYPGGGGWRK